MTPVTPASIRAALAARKVAQAAGPRTLADLARACGVSLSSLHQSLGGKRAMPAATEAAILAALPELSAAPAVAARPADPREAAIFDVLARFDPESREKAIRGRRMAESGEVPESTRGHQCLELWGIVAEAVTRPASTAPEPQPTPQPPPTKA